MNTKEWLVPSHLYSNTEGGAVGGMRRVVRREIIKGEQSERAY